MNSEVIRAGYAGGIAMRWIAACTVFLVALGCQTVELIGDDPSSTKLETTLEEDSQTENQTETPQDQPPVMAQLSAKPRALLPGKWTWFGVTCEQGHFAFELSADGSALEASSPGGVSLDQYQGEQIRYLILGEQDRFLTTVIAEEDRSTENGNTVIWHFLMINDDAFCWHRADWDQSTCTRPLARCPE